MDFKIRKTFLVIIIGLLLNNEGNGKPNIDPKEYLLGCWMTSHYATINMKFTRNGRFEFNDINAEGEAELLKGRYTLSGKTLTLFYDDRPKQKI